MPTAKAAAPPSVSRRERQILDVLFRLKAATAAEIQTALPDAPSYSAVRALLRIMEDKGHVRHREDGQRYVYLPAIAAESARRSALHHVLDTFFEGSAAGAMAALIDDHATRLSREELDRLQSLIELARRKA